MSANLISNVKQIKSLLRCNYYDECMACGQEDFVNDTLSLRGTENYYMERLSYFLENGLVAAQRHLRAEAGSEV